MTRPRPNPSWADRDIKDLPGIRTYVGNIDRLILASRRLRREAKAVLYRDMAWAAQKQLPLTTIAAHAAEPPGSVWLATLPRTFHQMASNRVSIALVILLIIGTAGIALPLLFVTMGVESRKDRVASQLARRLMKYLENGLPLSRAMERCGDDFDHTEVAIVKTGEDTGQLALALRGLAATGPDTRRIGLISAENTYPVVLLCMTASIASFVLIFIFPKFQDIFSQLGAELPALSMAVSHSFGLLLGGLWPLLMLLALWFALRAMMCGGSQVAFWIAAIAGGAASIPLVMIVAQLVVMPLVPGLPEQAANIAVFLIGFVFVLLAIPTVLSILEGLTMQLEAIYDYLLARVPFIGEFLRIEREARWMAGLATALKGGMVAHEAIRSAGTHCGGRIARRSEIAAQRAEAGVPIGRACHEAGILAPRRGARVMLACRSHDVYTALESLAHDMAEEANHHDQRARRLLENVYVILVGIVVGFITLAIYLPLFNLPQIVGR